MKLNNPSTLNKNELIDAIEYANDHPAMPEFYDLLSRVKKADTILVVNQVERELIIEALSDLTNWVDPEELEPLENLLGVLINARIPS